ncbi:DUF3298 and DUF4163 domain-containing protein [Hymenobacter actinosclerus]|uniref:DUF3298 domain-containing protein n=1 Tax=Hymenobacter actinosclerus TaxID=82805 RepID=A0A1I0AYV0_9BACT|nr:DUF3298 and DUF4163 domain-containing protein [Hymenobacter actinosclerus]SES99633.1 protein of unknown function [Hymenobacter actinosclerus]
MNDLSRFRPSSLLRQLPAPLALGLLLLSACNSGTEQSGATTDTAVAAPEPTNDTGSWYRQYRGLLPGTTDSVTLHLQRLGSEPGAATPGRIVGFYAGRDGHPYELGGDTGSQGDSLNLSDLAKGLAAAVASGNGAAADDEDEPLETGPEWLLKEEANQLVGTHKGQPVRLRQLRPAQGIRFAARNFVADVVPRPDHPEDSIRGHRVMHALVPFMAPNQEVLAANILRGLHGDTLDTAPVPALDSIWHEQLRAFTKDYRSDAAPLLAAAAKDKTKEYRPIETLAYEQEVNTYVLWNEGNLLSMGFFGYDYSGGAHGIYGTYVQSYDTRTGKSLRYDDIFLASAKPKLEKLLGQYARPSLGLGANEPLSKTLLVKTLPVTRNVYLTSGGAVFVYLPYEIAAYVYGQISIFVPFSEMQGLLKPGLPVGETRAVAAR